MKGRDRHPVFRKLWKSIIRDAGSIQRILSQIPLGSHPSGVGRYASELAADIATRGILLTGGGSMLFGMDDLIRGTTGIQTTAVDDPISAVAIGTGRYTEFIEGKQTKA